MTVYRQAIHCRIDPEQASKLPDGRVIQEVSVIMTDHHPFGEGRDRCWLPPSAYTLTPSEARALASELVEAAELAERIGDRE